MPLTNPAHFIRALADRRSARPLINLYA